MEDERRKFARLSVLADIILKKRELAPEEIISLTRNISKGGICFIVYEPVEESQIIDLTIYLPGEAPIKAVGKVAWVNEFTIGDTERKRYDVGLEFIEISDKDKALIDKYVFTRTPLKK